MANRSIRLVVATIVPVAALLVAQWFDTVVLVDARARVGMTYDPSPLLYGSTVAHMLTAAGAIAIALAAWRSSNLGIGVTYALVGGFLALLPALVGWLAIGRNGGAPLAPEPIARFLSDRWFDTMGVTGAVPTLGAAMLVSGLAVVISNRLVAARTASAGEVQVG